MGANIELDIFLRKEAFPLQYIFSCIEREGFSVRIQEMIAFDDWQYTNQTDVLVDSIDLNTTTIFLEKFMLIQFYVNDVWRCVLITSIEDNGYLNLSFGLDIDTVSQIRWETIDEDISALFDKITAIIDKAVGTPMFQHRFFAASMGLEYFVRFNNNVQTMLQDDNGAQRWVLPERVGREIVLERFSREEKSNTMVFRRSVAY